MSPFGSRRIDSTSGGRAEARFQAETGAFVTWDAGTVAAEFVDEKPLAADIDVGSSHDLARRLQRL